MDTDKRFSDAAMTGGYPPQQPPQDYAPQQGAPNPPPYVMQPQYGGQVIPPNAYNQYGGQPASIMTVQPARQMEVPPDTTCSLIVSILAIFFCLGAWPFAVVAIVFNRKARSQVDVGQYTAARNTLRTCFIFIGVTVILGIIAWIIFAVRLSAAMHYIDEIEEEYNYDDAY